MLRVQNNPPAPGTRLGRRGAQTATSTWDELVGRIVGDFIANAYRGISDDGRYGNSRVMARSFLQELSNGVFVPYAEAVRTVRADSKSPVVLLKLLSDAGLLGLAQLANYEAWRKGAKLLLTPETDGAFGLKGLRNKDLYGRPKCGNFGRYGLAFYRDWLGPDVYYPTSELLIAMHLIEPTGSRLDKGLYWRLRAFCEAGSFIAELTGPQKREAAEHYPIALRRASTVIHGYQDLCRLQNDFKAWAGMSGARRPPALMPQRRGGVGRPGGSSLHMGGHDHRSDGGWTRRVGPHGAE